MSRSPDMAAMTQHRVTAWFWNSDRLHAFSLRR
jgi:hypothetical protein